MDTRATTTPQVLVDFITTVDGYASGEGWPGWWGLEGPEYLGWLAEQQESEKDFTTLMGANTYRLYASFAAAAASAGGGMSDREAVRERKRTGTRSMRTNGSLSLCRSLLAAGLVDRFRVVLFPVITGRTGHERIYDGYPDLGLALVESRTFDGNIQLLEYVPTLISGPPQARPT